ncbi:MAG: UPF0149 family protein [Chromatiales bacterium]|nr:UPF0149 family protein [Chromatiales bacterium]
MSAAAGPGFHTVAAALHGAGSLSHPAEIHGSLCGRICLLGEAYATAWFAEVLEGAAEDATGRAEAMEVLGALGEATCRSLLEGDMSVRLLVPGDEAELGQRADALAHWCQGFIHGLASSGQQGPTRAALDDGLTGEIIRDFGELSRMAFTGEDTEAEAEAAYAELLEYVRVSVQLVFEELHALRGLVAGQGTH